MRNNRCQYACRSPRETWRFGALHRKPILKFARGGGKSMICAPDRVTRAAVRALALVLASVTAHAQAPADDASLVSRGEYLARAADCMPCRSGDKSKPYSGGLPVHTPRSPPAAISARCRLLPSACPTARSPIWPIICAPVGATRRRQTRPRAWSQPGGRPPMSPITGRRRRQASNAPWWAEALAAPVPIRRP